ncbi:MAG: hypothetical protein DMG41_04500 [Acidobacteria bacterium]|nr:MAG: hypothetical protein DMG42_01105 [Acidobacteriota bacterium]PYT90591.1 MAG: hypothetical protein DMG41_04500 [Acidobacteriota bacterium]
MFFPRGFSCIPSTRMRVPAGIASRMFKEVAVHAKSINAKIRSIPIRHSRDSRTIGTKSGSDGTREPCDLLRDGQAFEPA